MRLLVLAALMMWGSAALALSTDDLRADGYQVMECRFDQRCVLGNPCERAWRDMRWYLNDTEQTAYREYDNGRLQKGLLMKDARWKDTSDARAIVMQMREAVASHMTVFDGGGAIYSLQYAGNPGSGQFFLGQCDLTADTEKTE